MKKSILTSLTALAISTAQAGFIIKIPLEQTQGGALPDGSINMTPRTPGLPVENWQPAEPLYGEWVNNGAVYGCSNWTPATSTQSIGVIFQQTADDCKQDQTRNRQELEQETTTLATRYTGPAVTETQTVTASSTRTSTGTKECRWDGSYAQFYDNGVYVIDKLVWEGLFLRNNYVNPKGSYEIIYSFTDGEYIYFPENMINYSGEGIIDIYSGLCRSQI